MNSSYEYYIENYFLLNNNNNNRENILNY